MNSNAWKPFALAVMLFMAGGCLSKPLTNGDGLQAGSSVFSISQSSDLVPDGAKAFHLHFNEPTPYAGYFRATWDLDDFNAVQVVFLTKEGVVQPIIIGMEYDNSPAGTGDGVVAVGTPFGETESPTFASTADQPLQFLFNGTFQSNDGWLIVTWLHQPKPFQLEMSWEEPAQVLKAMDGQAMGFEMKDGQSGFHLISPGLGVVAGDTFHAGKKDEQVLFHVKYLAADVGKGVMVFTSQEREERLSLDGEPNPANCVACYRLGRVVFTMEGPVSAELTYAGSARQTKVLVAASLFPGSELPLIEWADLHTNEV